ncbi:hypothetical protein DEH18_29750 [Streptomyces sp. NHF165]|nr:hypothetical protein DEH18_29750 [Streptomyces sp. NHF165]
MPAAAVFLGAARRNSAASAGGAEFSGPAPAGLFGPSRPLRRMRRVRGFSGFGAFGAFGGFG